MTVLNVSMNIILKIYQNLILSKTGADRLNFKRIEMLVKQSQKEKHPTAAMGPKRFRPFRGPLKNPFVRSPQRIAVYLHLQLLKTKGVYY